MGPINTPHGFFKELLASSPQTRKSYIDRLVSGVGQEAILRRQKIVNGAIDYMNHKIEKHKDVSSIKDKVRIFHEIVQAVDLKTTDPRTKKALKEKARDFDIQISQHQIQKEKDWHNLFQTKFDLSNIDDLLDQVSENPQKYKEMASAEAAKFLRLYPEANKETVNVIALLVVIKFNIQENTEAAGFNEIMDTNSYLRFVRPPYADTPLRELNPTEVNYIFNKIKNNPKHFNLLNNKIHFTNSDKIDIINKVYPPSKLKEQIYKMDFLFKTNEMEREFLKAIDFSLWKPEEKTP